MEKSRSVWTALITVVLMVVGMAGVAAAAGGGVHGEFNGDRSGGSFEGGAEGGSPAGSGGGGAAFEFEFAEFPGPGDLFELPSPDGLSELPPENLSPDEAGVPELPEAPEGCQDAADQLMEQIRDNGDAVPEAFHEGIEKFCDSVPSGEMPSPDSLPNLDDLPGLPGLPDPSEGGEGCESNGPLSTGLAEGIDQFDSNTPDQADPFATGAYQLCNAIAQAESNVPSPGGDGLPGAPEAPEPGCLCDSLEPVTDALGGLTG